MAAALVAWTWFDRSRGQVLETEIGVWAAFLVGLGLFVASYAAIRFLLRRRWKPGVLAAATILILSSTALLGFGYWYIVRHPGFHYLID